MAWQILIYPLDAHSRTTKRIGGLIMEERKIGEVFNYAGVRLQVREANKEHLCLGCYFNRNSHCYKPYDGVGNCTDVGRKRVNIIFREVKE